MAESLPEPVPETVELPGKAVVNGSASASSLLKTSDPGPDQYGWGV